MLGIPRRFSHFVFGFIQSGLTCTIAAAIASFPPFCIGRFHAALAAVLAVFLAPDAASRTVCSSVYSTPVPANGVLYISNRNQLYALAEKK